MPPRDPASGTSGSFGRGERAPRGCEALGCRCCLAVACMVIACRYDVVFSRADAPGAAGGVARRAEGGSAGGGAGASGAPTATPPGAAGAGGAARAAPLAPGMSFQIQLTGEVDTTVDASLFVVDLFDISEVALAALTVAGRARVAYFSAGTAEQWRADVAGLPEAVLGNASREGPGETWLDVRAPSVRELMQARLDFAASRGFTGVLPSAVDGYSADTGFPIGQKESLDYVGFLAAQAHARGLAIALANSSEFAPEVATSLDFVVQERCLEFDECAAYDAFLTQGKPVLHMELSRDTTTGAARLADVCADPTRAGFSTVLKLEDYGAWRLACE